MKDEDRERTSAPSTVALVREAASRIGLTVEALDPEYGYLFRLSDGVRSATLLGGRSPLNDAVAARLAEDKYYTGLILKAAGFSVPRSVRCLLPGHFEQEHYDDRAGIEPAMDYAHAQGFPLIVKPNRLSHGRCVSLVHTFDELKRAIEASWRRDYIALVQEPIEGVDLRLDFLGGEFLAGYYRYPSNDVGSGTEQYVLNLARGASAEPIEGTSSTWNRFCSRIGKCMNLRHFGVDLRLRERNAGPDSATVIEVNSSPLLVQLSLLGFAEQAIAAQVRVLRAIMDQTAR